MHQFRLSMIRDEHAIDTGDDEDHPMLTPAQTMANEPKPVVITYQ